MQFCFYYVNINMPQLLNIFSLFPLEKVEVPFDAALKRSKSVEFSYILWHFMIRFDFSNNSV